MTGWLWSGPTQSDEPVTAGDTVIWLAALGGPVSSFYDRTSGMNARLNRMDWASVESSRKSTPLWAHEMAPGLAIRLPPPTMLATDAEWWGSL